MRSSRALTTHSQLAGSAVPLCVPQCSRKTKSSKNTMQTSPPIIGTPHSYNKHDLTLHANTPCYAKATPCILPVLIRIIQYPSHSAQILCNGASSRQRPSYRLCKRMTPSFWSVSSAPMPPKCFKTQTHDDIYDILDHTHLTPPSKLL